MQRILVQEGTATGIRLSGGEEIPARCVVSGLDPRRTFFDFVGAPRLGPEFNRKIANIRMRGTTATLHLLLDGLPPLPNAAQRLAGHTLVAPTLDYLERASDDAKYGRISARPHLDIVVPTLNDPTLAPTGQHIASIQVRYAPYELRACQPGKTPDHATHSSPPSWLPSTNSSPVPTTASSTTTSSPRSTSRPN